MRRCDGSFGVDTCKLFNVSEEEVSLIKGQQVAVGGNEKTALPLLILWFGSEGRAVLSNVLC